MNNSHTPWRRLWNFVSGNSCLWLLLTVLLVPLFQLAGTMSGRELMLYHPALDRLIFLDKFADEEIVGLKIHQEEFQKDWAEAFAYPQEDI